MLSVQEIRPWSPDTCFLVFSYWLPAPIINSPISNIGTTAFDPQLVLGCFEDRRYTNLSQLLSFEELVDVKMMGMTGSCRAVARSRCSSQRLLELCLLHKNATFGRVKVTKCTYRINLRAILEDQIARPFHKP